VTKAEPTTLFQDLKILRAVKRASIKPGTKIMKSHMFIVTKYLASGEYDKMKARLIADGRDQDPELYPNKSSLMVALHSMLTVLGLVASQKWRVMVKIIKGAFLQTLMEGELSYMRLDHKMTQYGLEMFPKLEEYIDEDDCLYTLMLKAIYGCIQASALWYALICRTLEEGGYPVSEMDNCIFCKMNGSGICLLLLHVDDILANVDREEMMALKEKLEEKTFGMIQFEEGGRLSCLGMHLELHENGTIVVMSFYVNQLV